jgi:PAS domain S-box-containing protein
MHHVLVVEDERIVAKDLERTLLKMGYGVPGLAYSSDQAIALATERRPDLVLMDLRIEGPRDGIATAAIMRERFGVPVVFLTAFADPDTLQRASEAAPYGYLVKPFSDSQLRSTIEIALYKHQMESRLKDRERQFVALLEAAPDAMVIVEESGAIANLNVQAATLFGYTRDELLRQSIEVLVPERSRADHAGHRAGYSRAAQVRMTGGGRDIVGRHKEGWEFPVEVTLSPLKEDGSLVIAAIRDVTIQRASERAAWNENRIKDEFMATLSHELRTPLSAILGWSGMLAAGTLDAEAAPRAVQSIARNARQLTQLVDDVLDVSRIVNGGLRLDLQSVAMATVIEAALDTVRPLAADKGIEIDVAPDREGLLVTGDPVRLRQIMLNLLINAVKFTPKGGRVQITLEHVNADARVTVADTGRGILPEFLPSVFDRFRQAEGGTTRRTGGLGLGLAIVRHLVELHGGSVKAESEGENRGSVFTVTLPLQAEQPDRRLRMASPRATTFHPEVLASSGPDLRGVTVLIVDDDAETRELLETIVRQANADAISAATAAEALDVLDRCRPDLMICDIGMPVEDGYSLIRKVRTRSVDDGGGIPAVALTAYARSEDRGRCLLAGFHSHMAKPAEPAELLALIAALVGRARAGSESQGLL